MAKTLDELAAEAEIRELHLRFCRANDRRDAALMRSCFHPDATIELHKPLDVEAFIAMGLAMLSRYIVTWHNTGNQLVEVDGDAAWAEHYTISSHRLAADAEGPERDLVASSRYVDRAERRDGEWRIARRVLLLDFMRMDPVVSGDPGFPTSGGTPDRADRSYALRLRR